MKKYFLLACVVFALLLTFSLSRNESFLVSTFNAINNSFSLQKILEYLPEYDFSESDLPHASKVSNVLAKFPGESASGEFASGESASGQSASGEFEDLDETPPRLVLDLNKFRSKIPRGYLDNFSLLEHEIVGAYLSLKNTEKFRSEIRASIVSSDPRFKNFTAEYFERLAQTQNVSTFILISENLSLSGFDNIQVSEYGYKTPYGNLAPNMQMAQFLQENGIGTSNRAFYNDKNLAIPAPFIKKSFPDSKILAINVKSFVTEEEIASLNGLLAMLAGEKEVLFLFPMSFAQTTNNNLALFHDELSRNIIQNFDISSVSRLDSNMTKNLEVLFSFLKSQNIQHPDLYRYAISDGFSSYFVNFYEGDNGEDRDITIMAFGDMMLGRYVRTLMDRHGKDYIFANLIGENDSFLKGSDYLFANLEGPIKGGGYKSGTSLVFGFHEDIAPFLKKYGFNILSITNNHALDQGWDGRATTIDALNNHNIGWCGHPSEADGDSVFYDEIGGKKIAFVCFQDITYRLNTQKAVELIKQIRPNVDFLIVSIHWGVEYQHKPHEKLQIIPGRSFVDAGADLIIGHHPHVVQSFEIYNDRLIFYSLGNFIFDQYWSVPTQEELGVGFVLNDLADGKMETKAYLFPIKSEMSQIRLLNTDEYDKWIEKFISYGNYSDDLKQQIRNGLVIVK